MARRPLWKRLVRWLAITAGVMVAALIVAMVLGVSVDLDRAREPISRAAGALLGRKVELEGPVRLTVGLVPAVEIGRVRIANPPGFSGPVFAQLGRAQLKAEVLPLLWGKLVVRDIEVQGVELHLEESADGRANWIFSDAKAKTEPAAEPAPSGNASMPVSYATGLDVRRLALTDIRADFTSRMSGQKAEFRIQECLGQGRPGEPIRLDFKGTAQGRPYTFTVRAVSLTELFNDNTAWLDCELTIAKTSLAFAGQMGLPISRPMLDVNAGISGGNMTDLGGLVGVDLPPWGPYQANCTLSLRKKRADLKDLYVDVGSSRLLGRAVADSRGSKPVVEVVLAAPSIQLDDFAVGNWTATGGTSANATQAASDNATSPANATAEANASNQLFSPGFLHSFDASLGVAVDEVLWGAEKLGRGNLNATLKDGGLRLDPVHLEAPGGSLDMNASLTPEQHGLDASLGVMVERFDFGILARHANPKTDMGGLFSLELKVRTRAPDLRHLMSHADGVLRVWAQPKNFKAGIMDLWAVNLFSAVMPKLEGGNASMINCLSARFTIKNGLMKPDKLIVDTSRIRIRGIGQVDFRTRTLDLNLAPMAKRPEFFSLATPVEVHGSMDKFGIGVGLADIMGTVVRFVASPVTVPIERLFIKDLPSDGSDVCGDGKLGRAEPGG